MRVLQSLTGSVTHMDGRERPWIDRDGNARVSLAEGPLCNGVGASRGNVRWYERKAKAVTCKSCLRILASQHAEAITENETHTLKADARADLAEVLAEVATEAAPKPAARRPVTEADMVVGAVVFKGNGKTAYRVYAVRTVSVYGGGTALRAGLVKTTTKDDPSRSTWWAASELTTEAEAPEAADVAAMTGDPVGWVTSMLEPAPSGVGSTVVKVLDDGSTVVDVLEDEEERSGMYVELSSGLTEYVEPGDRLQHKDSEARGTVTAVGPNALDLHVDNDTEWSGASWFWGRPSADKLPEVGPIDRQAVLSTRVDSLMNSGVTNARVADALDLPVSAVTPTGDVNHWTAHQVVQPVTDAQRAAELEQEGPLSRQLREVGSGSVQCPLLDAHDAHDWFTGGSTKSVRRCAGLLEDRMPKLYTPTGEAMTVLGSAVYGGRTGVWGVRVGRPLALAFFVDEGHLRLQLSAYRPGERARMADAARVATPVATPSQVAALLASMAEDAERYASGGVTGTAAREFGASMERWTAELARWLGMSEPVKLASYASPYGGPALAEVWQARAGVQPLLCRLASSRWTTYGATCNTPLSADGTCPEAHAHV